MWAKCFTEIWFEDDCLGKTSILIYRWSRDGITCHRKSMIAIKPNSTQRLAAILNSCNLKITPYSKEIYYTADKKNECN